VNGTYTLLRTTHLLLGSFSALFLLMYGASGVQMTHRWLDAGQTVVESDVAVSNGAAAGPRALAQMLMTEHRMVGQLASINQKPDGFSFQITRPGTTYQVAYTTGAASAHVKTSVTGWVAMLNGIHRVAGLKHDYVLLNVWAVFVGVVSAALLLLGLTGVYLWFQTQGERLIGGLIVGVGLAVGLSLMVLIRMQP
jgi:hypothetical protein